MHAEPTARQIHLSQIHLSRGIAEPLLQTWAGSECSWDWGGSDPAVLSLLTLLSRAVPKVWGCRDTPVPEVCSLSSTLLSAQVRLRVQERLLGRTKAGQSPVGTAGPGCASLLSSHKTLPHLGQQELQQPELLFSLPSPSPYQRCTSPLYALIKNQMRGREEEKTNNASYTFGLGKRKAHSNAFEDNKEEMIHA